MCAAEGVRLRQRFDFFFFSASESAAWLSPARETSAANPNFPKRRDGGAASADAAPSGAAANGTFP